MAQVGHRVDYLAGFCCPVGGLVAGKPRVLCHENEIYLSNGTEFVYVYDQEGKVLKVRGLEGWGFTVPPIPWGHPFPYPCIPSVSIQHTKPTSSALCCGVCWGLGVLPAGPSPSPVGHTDCTGSFPPAQELLSLLPQAWLLSPLSQRPD